MKLRYYLRGLAVGILVTTLILTIANRNNRPLTDAQIRERALLLGMEDGTSKTLSDLWESEPESAGADVQEPESGTNESIEPESEADAQEPESGTGESIEPESEADESIEPESGTDESVESQSTEPESETDESKEPESATDESVEPESETEVKPITITVPKGASSYSVSKDLAAAGLVADAAAYDAYLCDNGYSRKIHVGTFQIMPGSSEREIAEIIAK